MDVQTPPNTKIDSGLEKDDADKRRRSVHKMQKDIQIAIGKGKPLHAVTAIKHMTGVVQYLDGEQIWTEFQALDGHGVRLNGIVLAKAIIKVANSGIDHSKAWHGPGAAIKILRRMQERAIVPQVGLYRSLITACCQAREFDKALMLWDEVLTSGIQIDCIDINIGLNLAIEMKDVMRLERVFQLFEERTIHPDFVSYTTILKAAHFWPNLESACRDLHSQNAIEKSYSDLQYVSTGLSFQDRALPSLPSEGHTLKKLARGAGADKRSFRKQLEASFHSAVFKCGTQGCVSGVKLLADEMAKSSIGRQEFASIALMKAYGRKHQPERVISVLESVENPSIHCYNAAISAVLASEDFGYSKNVMQSISRRGLKPNSATFTPFIVAYAKLGQLKNAESTFKKMEERLVVDLTAVAAMCDAYVLNSYVKEAEGFLRQWEAKLDSRLNIAAYGSLLKGYSTQRDFSAALSLVRELDENGPSPDERIYDTIIDLCVRCGAFGWAMHFVRRMERSSISPDKLKYKRLFIDLYREAPLDGVPRSRNRSQRDSSICNVDGLSSTNVEEPDSIGEDSWRWFESFKFWLGMPNKLYHS